jgi:hypothetical protein
LAQQALSRNTLEMFQPRKTARVSGCIAAAIIWSLLLLGLFGPSPPKASQTTIAPKCAH